MTVSFEEEKIAVPVPAELAGSSFARVLVKANVVRTTKGADAVLLICSGIGLIISAGLFVMFTTSLQQQPIDVMAQQQQENHGSKQ